VSECSNGGSPLRCLSFSCSSSLKLLHPIARPLKVSFEELALDCDLIGMEHKSAPMPGAMRRQMKTRCKMEHSKDIRAPTDLWSEWKST